MREKIAKAVVLLTVLLLSTLSFIFAFRHNPDAPAEVDLDRAERPVPSPLPPSEPRQIEAESSNAIQILERGRAVYNREGCATCHSIAGVGNPRFPLDGAGDRWKPDELEAWTTAAGFAAELLPPGIVRRKERYRSLPEEDLKALVSNLATLKSEPALPFSNP
jgi:mono/diheme cytochrome c family protein